MAAKGKGTRAGPSVLGPGLPDVHELALNELTGIADRACGCFELRDARSGSWVRFKECREHGGKACPVLAVP